MGHQMAFAFRWGHIKKEEEEKPGNEENSNKGWKPSNAASLENPKGNLTKDKHRKKEKNKKE